MKYRAEIDGLRALAVVPVILFHAGFELFSGGFVGVDVFFVISGYLITTILIEDIENKRFSIVNFYERRARRILPVLYLVITLTFAFALFFWSPYDLKNVSQSLVSTVLFSNNILLIKEGNDYFGALNSAADINPLIHTWSLAVEEQFYLLFPLILLALHYLKVQRYVIVFLVLVVVIFSYALESYSGNEKYVFYATHYRAWQLLFGAICAVLLLKDSRLLSLKIAPLLAPFGLLLIAFSMFGLASVGSIGYWFYLLPTLGASLVILYSKPNGIVWLILGNRLLVGIGLISYSLYLWHQPVFSFLSYRLVDAADADHSLPIIDTLGAIALTFTLSIFSYFLVEKPFRNGTRFSRTSIGLSLATLSLVIFVVGLVGHLTQGYLPFKLKDGYNAYISYDNEITKVKSTNWGTVPNVGSNLGVVGDSASLDLQQAFKSIGVNVDRYALDGTCFQRIVLEEYCNRNKLNDLLEFVSGKEKIFLASNMLTENSVDGYISMVNILKQYTDVYVVGPFQFWKPTNVSFAAMGSSLAVEDLFYKGLDSRIVDVEEHLRSRIDASKVISKYSLYCDMGEETCSVYDKENNPIFYDGIHHTIEGWADYGLRIKEYFDLKKIVLAPANLSAH